MKTYKLTILLLGFILFFSNCNKKDVDSTVITDNELVEISVNSNNANSPRVLFISGVIKDAVKYYQTLYSDYTFKRFTLALLTEDEWNNDGPSYGIPNYGDLQINIAVDKDAAALAMNYPIPESDTILSEIDKIMIHELGHYFFTDVVQMKEQDNFSWEFMATYFALGYLNTSYEGWKIDEIKQANSSEINYRTVADFNTLYVGVGPINYDWYQRQFLILAKKIHNIKGKSFIVDFINTYRNVSSPPAFIDFLKTQDNDIVEEWLLDLETNL